MIFNEFDDIEEFTNRVTDDECKCCPWKQDVRQATQQDENEDHTRDEDDSDLFFL
jgi:hypothetical protein